MQISAKISVGMCVDFVTKVKSLFYLIAVEMSQQQQIFKRTVGSEHSNVTVLPNHNTPHLQWFMVTIEKFKD